MMETIAAGITMAILATARAVGADVSSSYRFPKTSDEWWNILTENWPVIKIIVEQAFPSHLYPLNAMLEAKDKRLLYYLMEAKTPDKEGIHSTFAWLVLSDLVSERHVLSEVKL